MTINNRIPSLDGLRMASIVMVLLCHSYFPTSGIFFGPLKLISNGPLGVSIFFVLSGFLITTLLVRELETTGAISLGNFYVRRSFRIFPAFYAYLGVVFVLTSLGVISASGECWWSSAFFLRNYLAPINDHVFTAHCWSLCVEEQFYALWPPLFAFLGRKRAVVAALSLIVLSPLTRVLSYILIPQLRPSMTFVTHARIDMLMFGCLAALLWDSATFRAWIRKAIDLRLPAVAMVFAVAVSPWLTGYLGAKYLLTVGYELEGASILLVILWLIERPDSLLGRVFNHPAVRHLGIISFSLYLWQQLFLNLDRTIPWSVALSAALLMAECSYWLIERPFLRLRARLRLGESRSSWKSIEQAAPIGPGSAWVVTAAPPTA